MGRITANAISEWEEAVREEREKLALLLDVYNVLFENADRWMTVDTIEYLLNRDKKRNVPATDAEDALGILKAPVIAAVIERTEERTVKYKAAMTPQTFHLRIRKLDEEILKHRSKGEPRTPGKLTSYAN